MSRISSCSEHQCQFGDQCQAQSNLLTALSKYFHHTSFRPGQLEVLLPVMHGKDVFARMATGAGKSICMFLPPLAWSDSACGVVISPLNGLMEQQVCFHCTSVLGMPIYQLYHFPFRLVSLLTVVYLLFEQAVMCLWKMSKMVTIDSVCTAIV